MVEKQKINHIIFGAIDEVNQVVSRDQRLEKSIETQLFGLSGNLDSLGIVIFIVAVEQRIQEELGLTISLADERAMSLSNSPFKTVGTLADYICSLLEEGRSVAA